MLSTLKKLNTRLSNQLPLILLLTLLLPLIVFQIQQRQTVEQEAAKNKNKNKNKNAGNNSSEKPNVIIFLTDDQPDNTMKYLPETQKKLGGQGVTFTEAFVPTGLCCPSRTSLLTGQYAHNTGVWSNRPPLGGAKFVRTLGKDKETLPVWLQRAGYKTALIGKYMNQYDMIAPYIPPGWDKWFAFDDDNGKYFDYKIIDNKKRKAYGDKATDYSTDVFAKEAVQFIKSAKKPFFLYFAPHAPHGVPRPAPRDEGKCDNARLPKNPAFNEADVSDKPEYMKKLPKLNRRKIKEQEENFALRMCTLKAVDDAVSDVIKALGNKRDNTIIIFTSDNGFSFGDHRWIKKECSYDVCVGVDMIISYPPLTPSKKTSSQFALNIDLAPTILDLAGIPIPTGVDGKSLKPILENPDTAVRNSFLIETYNSDSRPSGKDFAIRTKKFMYNELSTGERELYDLTNDPYELENVANKEQYANTIRTLSADLKAMKENKSPPSEPRPDLTSSPTSSSEAEAVTPSSSTPSPTPTPTLSGTPPLPSETVTPSPTENQSGDLEAKLNLTLNGIGSGGDSVNAKDSSLSNKDPYTLTREVTLEFWDGNTMETSTIAEIAYDSTSGKYTGSSFTDSLSPQKKYTVKIKVPNYLVRKFPETVQFTPGTSLTLPEVNLVSGDINNDNELSILDYNLMLNCYGEGEIPDSCFEENGVVGDLNDDAYVLEVDYNLFIREFSKITKGD